MPLVRQIKSVRDVNLAEAAMLAGLFKAPTKYAPHANLPASRARIAAGGKATFRTDPMWFTDYMRRSTVEWAQPVAQAAE